MAYRILEVGPGDSPLGESFQGSYNWPNFPNSDYTAVQPLADPWQKFPENLISLPNVTYIERPIQTADLKTASFDEVYARNVLSDPSIGLRREEILGHMGRVLRAGGLMTLLDTYTPEYAFTAEDVIDYFEQATDLRFTEKTTTELRPFGGQHLEVATPAWSNTAGNYWQVIRHNFALNSPSYTGRFTQLVKQ